MMSVLDFPVAEQYPSSTDTSDAGSSNRISHMSVMIRQEKRRRRLVRMRRRRRREGSCGSLDGRGMVSVDQLRPDQVPVVRPKVAASHGAVRCAFDGNAQSWPDFLVNAAGFAQISDRG